MDSPALRPCDVRCILPAGVCAAKSSSPTSVSYRFGPFEADISRRELRKFGLRVRLERKPFKLLIALLQRPGELVTRAELKRAVWGTDVFVDFEHGLNVAVKKLRGVLNDSAEAPTYIETVAGEGYCFIAEVELVFAGVPVEQDASQGVGETARSASTPDPSQVPPSPVNAPGLGFWKRWAPSAALIAGIVLLVIGTTLLWWWWARPNPARAGKIMLVVLPFENLSGDPTQEYLSDGITEELSARLGNLNSQLLGVIGRTSAMTYKHSRRTVSQIGKELAVDYVLEGSVRRDGTKLRITAQLVEVPGQTHVWAQTYDGDLRDLLRVEDGVAADIAREVRVSMALEQSVESPRRHLPAPEAHEAYLLGRYHWFKRTPDGRRIARQYFRSAIERDPEYAAAYAGLAETFPPKDEALAAARKAVDLDPGSGEARMALGWIQLYQQLDIKAAKEALEAAIHLDSNYAPAHHTYGEILAFIGRLPEAISEKKQALLLDPLFEICRASLAEMLSVDGQYDRALEQINLILGMDPQYPKAHESLGHIYMRMGKYQEAIRELELSQKYGGYKDRAALGYAYAGLGNRQEALRMRSELQEMERGGDPDSAGGLALIELGLGNNDQAIAWLEKMYQDHVDESLLDLKSEPIFDPLRSDPRFQELLRRMNFPL